MNSKNKLKKLIIDIMVSVVVFSIVGVTLFVEQRGFQAAPNTTDSCLIDEDSWYAIRNPNAGTVAENAPKCLIVFDKEDHTSIELKKNMEYVLKSINVSVQTHGIEVRDNNDEDVFCDISEVTTNDSSIQINDVYAYNDVIFCISDLSSIGISYDDFSEWVSSGGHAMFAMGLEPTENLLKWSNILGIKNTEIPSVVTADSMRFKTSMMVGVEDREFSDDVIECPVLDVSVDDNCLIHLTTCDEEEIPLLWEKNIGNGKVIISNADLFESKADRGIFTATYCMFYPVFTYPVINAAVYCIDDCPAPAPAGYDSNVLSQFGYTVNDYISNVWMPEMFKIAEEYDIRYTTFVIQSYEDDVDGPFDNQDNIKTAKYYATQILNRGGEIGIHGYNHQPLVLTGFEYDKENEGYKAWPSIKKIIESIDAVKKYTEGLADELYVQAYIAPSNVISDEALNELQNQFEDIRVYAGVYVGTPDQLVQEFDVLDNGTAYCPRLTADMQMEDSEWWVQINELNYHYVESNFIHPDDILDEERNDGGDFAQMLANYRTMIEWNQRYNLRTCTISECGAAVQRYRNLNYTQSFSNDTLKINVNGLIDRAYMMLRLNDKKLISMSGGTYKKLNDNVYVLEIENDNIEIKLVER